jgi:hypothetical protein
MLKSAPAAVPSPGCRIQPFIHAAIRSPGQALEHPVLNEMRSLFDHDFGDVRIHTDDRSAESARMVHARAYTVGRDVVFASGQYSPGSGAGRRLLAHELAHIVQQRGARYAGSPVTLAPSSRDDGLELEAARASSRAVLGLPTPVVGASVGPALQRDVDPAYRRMLSGASVGRLYRERRLLEERLSELPPGSLEWTDAVQQEQMILEELELRGFPPDPAAPGETTRRPPIPAPGTEARLTHIGGQAGARSPSARSAAVAPPRPMPAPAPADVSRSVLALGRYERPIAAAGGRSLPVLELLRDEAQAATGLRPVLLGGLPSFRESFPRLAPSGLASAAVVQEALEGGGPQNIRAIYLNTSGVDFYRGGPLYRADAPGHLSGAGAQTSAEYRNVVAALAAGSHRVDVYIRHERGLSIIRARQQAVEGAPLPDFLRRHLPPSFFRRAAAAGTPPRAAPAQPARPPGRAPAAGAAPARVAVPGRIPAPPRGGAVRSIAGGAGVAALGLGLGLLVSYLRSRWHQRQIEADVRRMEPEIQACLTQLQPEIARLTAARRSNERVYANLTLILHYERDYAGIDPEIGGAPQIIYLGADLSSVGVSMRNLQDERMEHVSSSIGRSCYDIHVTYSIPL